MKSMILALTLSAISLNAYSSIYEAEVQKDLAGEKSCFGGEIKKLHDEMEDTYGGRFSGSYEIAAQTVAEETYRYSSKYCGNILDSAFNVVDYDDPNGIYRQCDSTDTRKDIVTINFSAATSGTFELKGVAFIVDNEMNTELIVTRDASYQADEDEIISEKYESSMKCRLINLY
jgi:hypothetical protein